MNKAADVPDFESKALGMRERIIHAATDIIFEMGSGALTLASTAERVGLRATSITHYFKRKDELASAVFALALERMEALVAVAERQASAQERVSCYVMAQIDILRRVRQRQALPIPALSGILSLGQPHREELVQRYRAVFRRIRGSLGPTPDEHLKRLHTARAHVLQEVVFWLPAALHDYAEEDFERFGRRLLDIFANGIASQHSAWTPRSLTVPPAETAVAYRDLLRAATNLINERGYSGASVNKIVAQLRVSKGAFYHRLDSRDDLTLDCFFTSFRTISRAQSTARGTAGDAWSQLVSAIAWLLKYQFSEEGPLLRTTALQGLTPPDRHRVMQESDRIARRFSAFVIDAMLDGSARLVDPLIAAQALMPMINAAYVMRGWAARQAEPEAVALYASTILWGLLRPLPAGVASVG